MEGRKEGNRLVGRMEGLIEASNKGYKVVREDIRKV